MPVQAGSASPSRRHPRRPSRLHLVITPAVPQHRPQQQKQRPSHQEPDQRPVDPHELQVTPHSQLQLVTIVRVSQPATTAAMKVESCCCALGSSSPPRFPSPAATAAGRPRPPPGTCPGSPAIPRSPQASARSAVPRPPRPPAASAPTRPTSTPAPCRAPPPGGSPGRSPAPAPGPSPSGPAPAAPIRRTPRAGCSRRVHPVQLLPQHPPAPGSPLRPQDPAHQPPALRPHHLLDELPQLVLLALQHAPQLAHQERHHLLVPPAIHSVRSARATTTPAPGPPSRRGASRATVRAPARPRPLPGWRQHLRQRLRRRFRRSRVAQEPRHHRRHVEPPSTRPTSPASPRAAPRTAPAPDPNRAFCRGMIAVCGIGSPSGCRNSAVTANQSAIPPTNPAFALACSSSAQNRCGSAYRPRSASPSPAAARSRTPLPGQTAARTASVSGRGASWVSGRTPASGSAACAHVARCFLACSGGARRAGDHPRRLRCPGPGALPRRASRAAVLPLRTSPRTG